jgi:hypothetical protein
MALRNQAKRSGLSPERYVRQLIEEHLAREHVARSKTFDELFASVRAHVNEVDEAEVGDLIERVRAKQGRRKKLRRK